MMKLVLLTVIMVLLTVIQHVEGLNDKNTIRRIKRGFSKSKIEIHRKMEGKLNSINHNIRNILPNRALDKELADKVKNTIEIRRKSEMESLEPEVNIKFRPKKELKESKSELKQKLSKQKQKQTKKTKQNK